MLIESLQQKQAELGLSDGQFAEALGVSPSMWSLVKSQRRRPGLQFLHGVTKRFPELQPECLLFLRATPTISHR